MQTLAELKAAAVAFLKDRAGTISIADISAFLATFDREQARVIADEWKARGEMVLAMFARFVMPPAKPKTAEAS